jgi:hypothetical protein
MAIDVNGLASVPPNSTQLLPSDQSVPRIVVQVAEGTLKRLEKIKVKTV